MSDSVTIRLLDKQDAPAYQQLRLQSLQTDPDAFLSSYEAESRLHDTAFAEHLDWAYHPPCFGYFGIFVNDKLVGYIQAGKNFLEKQEHVGSLYNLYVSKEFRHQGLASRLINHVVGLLRQEAEIERVFLSCTARNPAAYKLYRKLGFKRIGVKARAIKWNGQYDDEIEMVKLLLE